MTNPLYPRLQATADRMVGKFGAPGSILSVVPPDEINGGDPVTVQHPCRVVIVAFDASYINGSSITANDVQLFISAVDLDVEPLVGMQVTAGGRTYQIVSIDPNRFDGETPVVYVAQGRTAS